MYVFLDGENTNVKLLIFTHFSTFVSSISYKVVESFKKTRKNINLGMMKVENFGDYAKYYDIKKRKDFNTYVHWYILHR